MTTATISRNSTIITQASTEWATRPNDERFTSLTDLLAKVSKDRASSRGKVISTRKLEVMPDPANPMHGLQVVGQAGTPATPSHWAFGQLASLANAPGGYLRSLPAPIAADALNYSLLKRPIEDVGLLVRRDFDEQGNASLALSAATGPKYGRVWNSDIATSLVDKFGDGISGHWRVPGEFGRKVEVTKANTTLYASDRDMFVFLADEENRIHLPNRRNGKSGSLARGFFVWNSEVGASTFGIAMFLFDYVCCNRIVWGVEGHKEIRIRHTVSAPDRWLEQVAPVIADYSAASAKPIEQTLLAAQAAKVDDLADFVAKRRYSKGLIRGLKDAFEADEGRPIESLWDVSTALTAHARSIAYQDERVAIEREAGKVLDLVTV